MSEETLSRLAGREITERLLLCRFSVAGIARLSARSCSRRPKSAKARSRGELGTGWQRALWGFDVGAEVDFG
jgi:hypothetical protein